MPLCIDFPHSQTLPEPWQNQYYQDYYAGGQPGYEDPKPAQKVGDDGGFDYVTVPCLALSYTTPCTIATECGGNRTAPSCNFHSRVSGATRPGRSTSL